MAFNMTPTTAMDDRHHREFDEIWGDANEGVAGMGNRWGLRRQGTGPSHMVAATLTVKSMSVFDVIRRIHPIHGVHYGEGGVAAEEGVDCGVLLDLHRYVSDSTHGRFVLEFLRRTGQLLVVVGELGVNNDDGGGRCRPLVPSFPIRRLRR